MENKSITMDSDELKKLLPDFPSGPLSYYRQKASFNWRTLKLEMESEESIRYKNKIWESFWLYDISKDYPKTLPLDEQRRISQLKLKLLSTKTPLELVEIDANPKLQVPWIEAIFMYDVTAGMAYSITHKMFIGNIDRLGTSRHEKFKKAAQNNEIVGCFALTEVAHGSNAKGMQTTATYDPINKQFVMHSANFEAAKIWAGMLGHRATHAFVFAKLITPDGKDQGLHAFIVPIRCPKTLKAYSGILVGDMGEKMGLNGMDNGFLMFNSYRIPAENLLNGFGDVDEEGNYFSLIENPNHRFAMAHSGLSMGRVQITSISTTALQKAITIAIRYSAARKQFAPENSDNEYPVLEYQQQQFRLIPYLAATYAMRIFSNWFLDFHSINESKPRDPDKYIEVHALSSATKPIITWIARNGIQVCREACGGHGYLKVAGFGDLRSENDGNCTYEGENTLLLQQTSNWLLSLLRTIDRGEKINTPYNTVGFLNDYKQILNSKKRFDTTESIIDITNILDCFKWLISYTLSETAVKIARQIAEGKDRVTARNNSQSFYSVTVSTLYAEYCILNSFHNFVTSMKDIRCKEVMTKVESLFGSWCIEKHLGTLYIGGYFSNNEALLLRNGIIDLCRQLASDSVALVDAFAPPDFVLNSVLGKSDGNVYQHLQSHLFSCSDTFTRPDWWKEIVDFNNIKSKL